MLILQTLCEIHSRIFSLKSSHLKFDCFDKYEIHFSACLLRMMSFSCDGQQNSFQPNADAANVLNLLPTLESHVYHRIFRFVELLVSTCDCSTLSFPVDRFQIDVLVRFVEMRPVQTFQVLLITNALSSKLKWNTNFQALQNLVATFPHAAAEAFIVLVKLRSNLSPVLFIQPYVDHLIPVLSSHFRSKVSLELFLRVFPEHLWKATLEKVWKIDRKLALWSLRELRNKSNDDAIISKGVIALLGDLHSGLRGTKEQQQLVDRVAHTLLGEEEVSFCQFFNTLIGDNDAEIHNFTVGNWKLVLVRTILLASRRSDRFSGLMVCMASRSNFFSSVREIAKRLSAGEVHALTKFCTSHIASKLFKGTMSKGSLCLLSIIVTYRNDLLKQLLNCSVFTQVFKHFIGFPDADLLQNLLSFSLKFLESPDVKDWTHLFDVGNALSHCFFKCLITHSLDSEPSLHIFAALRKCIVSVSSFSDVFLSNILEMVIDAFNQTPEDPKTRLVSLHMSLLFDDLAQKVVSPQKRFSVFSNILSSHIPHQLPRPSFEKYKKSILAKQAAFDFDVRIFQEIERKPILRRILLYISKGTELSNSISPIDAL
jgi:hypothetical protein